MSRRPAFNEVVRGYASFLILSCGAALLLPLVVRAQVKPSTKPPAPAPDGAANTPAPTAFTQLGSEVAAVFAKSKDAVVRIYATDPFGTCIGTGFFIDPSGTIYTHYSVVDRSSNVLVEFAGKKYPATCLLADPHSGVTLLSIHAGSTPFLPLAHATDLKIASPLIAIGYPMDLPLSPTFGLVAGFEQKLPEGEYLPTTHIRANVPMQPGEQGAPLLDEKGEVVGMVVCGFDYGAVCLGLPIQAAEKVRADYLRFGRTRPGWVGVFPKPVGDAGEESGVTVDDLADNGPAAHSGLAVGDLLIRVGNTPIHKLADLRDASFYMTADQTVPIVVQRGDKELTIQTHASDPPGVSMALPPLISNHAPNINTKLDPLSEPP